MKKILFIIACFCIFLLSSCANSLHEVNGHNYSKIVVLEEPTCKTEGKRELICSCGDKKTESIPTFEHVYEWSQFEPGTCIEQETLIGICMVCGEESYKLGENFGEHKYKWSTYTAATCTEEEILEGICVCKDRIEKPGEPALGHKYEWSTYKAATCTEEEILEGICVCKDRIEKPGEPALGHKYEWSTYTAATCTEDEILEGICVCKDRIEKPGEPALGHKYEWSTYKAATCTEEEILEGICVCKDRIEKPGEPALGHKYKWTILKEVSNTSDEILKGVCLCGDIKTEIGQPCLDPGLNTYSHMIKYVHDLGVITGVKANPSTKDVYKIGGTDLGIPFYDESREQMYLLFGDTFSRVNQLSGTWRSQVVGISSDFNLNDGLSFDSFISDSTGKAIQIIDSRHDGNDDGGEKTCIPTGGISIDGVHYIFYMSIREWLDVGWDVNFCAVAKSTDAKNYEILTDLYWAEGTDIGNSNILDILGDENYAQHTTSNFLQIFPYQVGEYIYLFGLTAGRFGGCKLGRVKIENIEKFSEYEYYAGKDNSNNPIWIKGYEGLAALQDCDDSFLVKSHVAELSVCYNPYLQKHVMSYLDESKNAIVMRMSDDLFNWTEVEIITTSQELIKLYGGFSHELYMEDNGKVMYFLVSQYQDDFLGDEGYNVRLLKVTFK